MSQNTPTLGQIITHRYSQVAESIFQIKQGSRSVNYSGREGFRYVSPDDVMKQSGTRIEGWTLKKVKLATERSIHPGHINWGRYQGAKKQAHLLMMAKLILKHNDNTIPDMADLELALDVSRSWIRSQATAVGRARKMLKQAIKLLNKLQGQLEKDTKRFQSTTLWIEERALARKQREEVTGVAA